MTGPWWQERVIYQIYPRSFQDINGDGIGDLPGILAHLDDLKDLGVGALWLSPVNASPNVDFGYDISDYRSIHPDFGSMDDMHLLLAEAARRDIRIIMDLVVNHTSDQHEWFQKSRQRIEPYTDYYIWLPGRADGKPPNNWTGFFGGPCWTFDEVRGEYYLHLFAREQPDLNYQSPAVFEEIKQILRYWLDKGVAGFRCDVINILFKASLADGKRSLILTGIEHYLSREETHELLQRLRAEVADEYGCFTVGETVFVTPKAAQDFVDPKRRELDMVFPFEHMETDQILAKWIKRRFHAGRFMHAIANWQQALDWNANYLENHDQPRAVSRLGNDGLFWKQSAKMLACLLLTLRGTPFLYQGQEIGMTNFDYTSMDQIRDTESILIDNLARRLHLPAWLRWRMIRLTSRDNARTPMQWKPDIIAGFTEGTPWLKVNDNYGRINYADQKKDPDSILHFYRRLIALRSQTAVLLDGAFHLVKAGRRLCAFERVLGREALVILMNFSTRSLKVRLPETAGATQVLSSAGRTDFDGTLSPYEAVILKREATT